VKVRVAAAGEAGTAAPRGAALETLWRPDGRQAAPDAPGLVRGAGGD
jgi:hypothetical protein